MSSRGETYNSELEELKHKYYKELRDEKVKIHSNGRYLECPYCQDPGRKYDSDQELIRHSSRIGRESKSASFRDKAKHLGLLKYLERYGDKKKNLRSRRRSLERFQDSRSYKETAFISSNDQDRVHSDEREIEGIYHLIEDGISSGRATATTVALKSGPSTMDKSVKSPPKDTLPSLRTESHVHKQSKRAAEPTVALKSGSCTMDKSVKSPPKGSLTTEYHVHKRSKMKDDEDLIVWPSMAIVANLPVEYKNGKYVGESGTKLKEDLMIQGYNPVKVHPLWSHKGHSGFAIVEFDRDWGGFKNAVMLEKKFEVNHHGKKDWYARTRRGDEQYAWIARDEEYLSNNIIGHFLNKHGDLKTISEIEKEDAMKDTKLVSNLENELVIKSKKCEQMQKKISRTEILVGKVMNQKEEIIENYNDEINMMQQKAHYELQNILSQHHRSKSSIEAHRKELEMREKELMQRQALNEREKRKIDHQKEMNERAMLEQNKADKKMMKLAEEQKREKERLHAQIIELEANLDQKQALELEIGRMKGAIEVMKHMNEEGDAEALKKKQLIEEELTEKEEELDNLDRMNQTLIIKERNANDELQDARKELIHGLQDRRANICVKRMGDLDEKPFHVAAKKKYSKAEAEEKALELCSLWEDHLRDPSWHPYKIITEGEKVKEIIDDNDEKLSSLKEEYGDGVYNAVITALNELNEYNPSGRYPLPELWNMQSGKKASLKEGAAHILKLWRLQKRKR